MPKSIRIALAIVLSAATYITSKLLYSWTSFVSTKYISEFLDLSLGQFMVNVFVVIFPLLPVFCLVIFPYFFLLKKIIKYGRRRTLSKEAAKQWEQIVRDITGT